MSQSIKPQGTPDSQCIAIIGDMVKSRHLHDKREKAQKVLAATLDRLNREQENAILSRFLITTGDEFQGLLLRADCVPDLMWTLEWEFRFTPVRFGIGCGVLSTPWQEIAVGMDGPVWHRARQAIETAKKARLLGGVFCGFGDEDDIVLNGFARLLHFQRARWSASQFALLCQIRDGLRQAEVAAKRKVTPSAVSQQIKAAGWEVYQEGEAAWRRVLSHFDFTHDWRSFR